MYIFNFDLVRASAVVIRVEQRACNLRCLCT